MQKALAAFFQLARAALDHLELDEIGLAPVRHLHRDCAARRRLAASTLWARQRPEPAPNFVRPLAPRTGEQRRSDHDGYPVPHGSPPCTGFEVDTRWNFAHSVTSRLNSGSSRRDPYSAPAAGTVSRT